MRLIITLLFLSTGFTFQAQQLKCKIIAPSGMNVRAEPSTKAVVIGQVYKDSIVYIESRTYGELTLEGIPGYWRKTEINSKSGYIWDGYLEIIERVSSEIDDSPTSSKDTITQTEPEIETKTKQKVSSSEHNVTSSENNRPEMILLLESYNHCGDVSSINPSAFWYAFVPVKKNVLVKEVELNITLSKSRLGKEMEFDILSGAEGRSLFIIGSENALNFPEDYQEMETALRAGGRQVMPGQRKILLDEHVRISALGNVKSIDGDCPIIENYALSLDVNNHTQDLLKLLPSTGECGIPDIYWYGDLTGDGYPEIIMVSVSDDANIFTLLRSREDKHKRQYYVESIFTMGNCQ